MRPRPALIELVVADIATSLAFYRTLGLPVPPDTAGQPHVDVEFGALRLAFDTPEVIRSFDPGWTPPGGGHRIALAFECDSPAQVDSCYAEVTAAGYQGHLEPWDAFWGMRYAVLHDPDGNPVDLFAPLAAGEVEQLPAGELEQ